MTRFVVGGTLFLIGASGLDSTGIGWWICAVMALVGLLLIASGTKGDASRDHFE